LAEDSFVEDGMEGWNGQPVKTFASKGGVLALEAPWAGVVRGGVSPWPPAELIQKTYKSEHGGAFADHAGLSAWSGGYYTDLQSLHCEDALTWSVFGTLSRAPAVTRARYAAELLQSLGVPAGADEIGDPDVWLWRRVPHPETLVSGGPEIDFCIQGERVLVLGEAKWRSSVGKGQGVRRDMDQMQIRRMVVEKWHRAFFPEYSRFVLLLVGRESEAIEEDIVLGCVTLHVRQITWAAAAALASHPHCDELVRYVAWKGRHSLS